MVVDVYNRLRMSESGGNRFAKNPRSSALGPDQFLNSTWLTTVKKYRPDLAAGKSDAEVLALRTNENISGEMTRRYGDENMAYLRARGITPGPGAIKLSHFAGPKGAAAIYSDPNAPVEKLLGRRAIEANPFMRGWSGQKAIDWAARIEGGGKGTMPTTSVAAAPATGGSGGFMPVIAAPPSERRRKMAEALMSQAFQTANQAQNPLGALAAIAQAAAGRFAGDRYDEEKSARSKAMAEALMGAKTPDDLQRVMLASGDDDLTKAVLEQRLAAAKPRPPIEVGGQLVQQASDGTYQPVYTPPAKPEEPKFVEIFDEEGRPVKALVNSAGQYKIVGAPKAPEKTEREKLADAANFTGQKRIDFLAGIKSGTEKWNEGQSKAANFGNMMVEAENLIAGMGPKDDSGKPLIGADGQPVQPGSPKGVAGAVRDALVPFQDLRNTMTGKAEQNYKQAAAQWIRAKLRKESGASIATDEMEQEFRTYFPQLGDGPDVIRQKADARREATRGMIAESAGAYQHFFGQNGAQPAPSGPEEAAAAPPAPAAAPAPRAVPNMRHIEALIANPAPEVRAEFDRKFGDGAAEHVLRMQAAEDAKTPARPIGIDPATGRMR